MQTKTVNLSPGQKARQKYAVARNNLLLMLILTVVNIVLYLCGSQTMMLFSATIPYFAVVLGSAGGYTMYLVIGLGIAAVLVISYLLCWIFSKKHYGWMIAALVLFIIDTVAMVGLYLLAEDISGVLDVLFHIWVLYDLVIGVHYGSMLKKLPAEEPVLPEEAEEISEAEAALEDSRPLRRADTEVKARILLEADAMGHHVVYRRVKRTNELVIDGYVYDEVEMLLEREHALTARIDGYPFEVGFDGVAYSYLEVNHALVERKRRLW